MTGLKNKNVTAQYLLFCFAILLVGCDTENSASDLQGSPTTETTLQFDSVRAAKLGADDYGMKRYVMAFLKRGPNRETDEKKATELQRAHMENIKRLAEEGKLILAGPFFGTGDLRGIYVFDVETVEEAEALTNTDPAIQAGSLEMELIPWYGSAALMEVQDIHTKIAKTQY